MAATTRQQLGQDEHDRKEKLSKLGRFADDTGTTALFLIVGLAASGEDRPRHLRPWTEAENRAKVRVMESEQAAGNPLDLAEEIEIEYKLVDSTDATKLPPINTDWIESPIRSLAHDQLGFGELDERDKERGKDLFQAIVECKAVLNDAVSELAETHKDHRGAMCTTLVEVKKKILAAARDVQEQAKRLRNDGLPREDVPEKLAAKTGPGVPSESQQVVRASVTPTTDDNGNPLPADFFDGDWQPSTYYKGNDDDDGDDVPLFTTGELEKASKARKKKPIDRVKYNRKLHYRISQVRMLDLRRTKLVDSL